METTSDIITAAVAVRLLLLLLLLLLVVVVLLLWRIAGFLLHRVSVDEIQKEVIDPFFAVTHQGTYFEGR